MRAKNIVAGYGNRRIIDGLSMYARDKEIVSVIGHNGAGKSTLLRAFFGVIPIWSGEVSLKGESMSSFSPQDMLGKGVVYVPQEGGVFENLTVRKNLKLRGLNIANTEEVENGMESVLDIFPQLKPRLGDRARNLSGGQKQMVALGSGLVLSPELMLLDEPSLGLSPSLVEEVFNQITLINRTIDITIVLVEQKVKRVLDMSDRTYVLRNGEVSFSGNPDDLDDKKLSDVYL